MTDVVCQIAAGELDAQVVHRSEHLVAFLDHRPVIKGHVLVCPLPHVDTLPDLDAARLPGFFTAVQHSARIVPPAFGSSGSFVAMNNVVSQSIPHLHAHVVPRTKGDGLRGFFWPRYRYEESEAEQFADRIRAALAGDPLPSQAL